MTEPLDLDAIEDSYMGYDPDYPVFRLIAAVRERDAEIERRRLLANADHEKIASLAARLRDLRAPPGADVMERPISVYQTREQYGDERAAAARAAAIEEAKHAVSWAIHDIGLPATVEGNLELRTRLAQTAMAAIGALKPSDGT